MLGRICSYNEKVGPFAFLSIQGVVCFMRNMGSFPGGHHDSMDIVVPGAAHQVSILPPSWWGPLSSVSLFLLPPWTCWAIGDHMLGHWWNASWGHGIWGKEGRAAWCCKLSSYVIDSVALVKAGNICVDISSLPTTLVTSVLPEPPVWFTTVSPLVVWGLINIFPSGSL